jgi:hypothetical protein
MRQASTYHIIEIDAGDKATVLQSGLSRKDAREKLGRLRDTYGRHGLRYVMYHDMVPARPLQARDTEGRMPL